MMAGYALRRIRSGKIMGNYKQEVCRTDIDLNNQLSYNDGSNFTTFPRAKQKEKTLVTKSYSKEGSLIALSHSLDELWQTENQYVAKLEYMVNTLMVALSNDPKLGNRGYENVIFGNIREILSFHQNIFLHRLEEVIHSGLEVAALMLEFYQQFSKLYIKYSLNIPLSSRSIQDKYIKKFFEEVTKNVPDRKIISDYIIAPIQRITRYSLMLDNMRKTYVKANEPCDKIIEACNVLKDVPALANNAVRLNSILNYPGSFTGRNLRELRQHSEFTVWTKDKKFLKRKYYVYLMEDRIIFTKIRSDDAVESLCTFKKEIHFIKHEISLKKEIIPDKDEKTFLIGTNLKDIYMQAESMTVKENWITDLRELINAASDQCFESAQSSYEASVSPVNSRSPSCTSHVSSHLSQNSSYHDCFSDDKPMYENEDSNTATDESMDNFDEFVGRLYYVITDFNPNEKQNGFVVLRKGHIYEVKQKGWIEGSWLVFWTGKIISQSHQEVSSQIYGFDGLAYPQYFEEYFNEELPESENNLSRQQDDSDISENREDGSDISDTKLDGSDISDTKLDGSDISDTKLDGSDISEMVPEHGEYYEDNQMNTQFEERIANKRTLYGGNRAYSSKLTRQIIKKNSSSLTNNTNTNNSKSTEGSISQCSSNDDNEDNNSACDKDSEFLNSVSSDDENHDDFLKANTCTEEPWALFKENLEPQADQVRIPDFPSSLADNRSQLVSSYTQMCTQLNPYLDDIHHSISDIEPESGSFIRDSEMTISARERKKVLKRYSSREELNAHMPIDGHEEKNYENEDKKGIMKPLGLVQIDNRLKIQQRNFKRNVLSFSTDNIDLLGSNELKNNNPDDCEIFPIKRSTSVTERQHSFEQIIKETGENPPTTLKDSSNKSTSNILTVKNKSVIPVRTMVKKFDSINSNNFKRRFSLDTTLDNSAFRPQLSINNLILNGKTNDKDQTLTRSSGNFVLQGKLSSDESDKEEEKNSNRKNTKLSKKRSEKSSISSKKQTSFDDDLSIGRPSSTETIISRPFQFPSNSITSNEEMAQSSSTTNSKDSNKIISPISPSKRPSLPHNLLFSPEPGKIHLPINIITKVTSNSTTSSGSESGYTYKTKRTFANSPSRKSADPFTSVKFSITSKVSQDIKQDENNNAYKQQQQQKQQQEKQKQQQQQQQQQQQINNNNNKYTQLRNTKQPPPLLKPKPIPLSNDKSIIIGNFTLSEKESKSFFEITEPKKRKAKPPPLLPKNRNLIKELMLPTIVTPLKDKAVVIGDYVKLLFEISEDLDQAKVNWYKDDVILNSSHYIAKILRKICTLEIYNITESDEGLYEARITGKLSEIVTKCYLTISKVYF